MSADNTRGVRQRTRWRPAVRPWLCPEPRCLPLLNLRDGDYKDLTVAEPGHSFTCWGQMPEPVTFIYDGVDHTNDHNCCHYTPLKGLLRWQENADDWDVLCTYYGLAAKLARAPVASHTEGDE
jgi:hypothetical protein